MENVISVILGGGAGSRLFPLTLHRCKPAVPLAGKYRLVDIPISNCINSQIHRIFVLTQFNSASLNRHIAMSYPFDRFRRGFVNILAAEQTPSSTDWFQGTADAVRQSYVHLDTYGYDHLLVLSGDQLYSMDYRELLAHHVEQRADLTVATIPVTAEQAPGLGILSSGTDHRVLRFDEKPPHQRLADLVSPVSGELQSAGRVFLASMGIYVFRQGVLQELLDASPDAHDFGKQIIPAAIDALRVVSYPFDGYWSDIGTIRSFYEANLMLTRAHPSFDMFNARMPLYTNARALAPAKLQSADVTRSIIAEASVVERAEIANSVIGLRAVINHGAVVRNTILMGAEYYPWTDPEMRNSARGPDAPGIGAGAHVENAIIDRNVSVGKDCRIANDDGIQEADGENYFIREGLVVIPKNVSIPDGTVI